VILNKDDKTAEYCKELFDVLLPALRFKAKSCGYAIGIHGSLRRDIDLIAAPWREAPVPPERLIENLEQVCLAVVGSFAKKDAAGMVSKPCGRLAQSIYLTPFYGDGPYLDISVMPVVERKPEQAKKGIK
jgi:hypothetical protein